MSKPYLLTQLNDLPALVVSFEEQSDFKNNDWITDSSKETFAILDGLQHPIFYIIDGRNLRISLDEIIHLTKVWVIDFKLFSHANIREIIFVSQNKLYNLSAKGMNSSIFGFANLKVYPTMDQALAYIRDKVQ